MVADRAPDSTAVTSTFGKTGKRLERLPGTVNREPVERQRIAAVVERMAGRDDVWVTPGLGRQFETQALGRQRWGTHVRHWIGIRPILNPSAERQICGPDGQLSYEAGGKFGRKRELRYPPKLARAVQLQVVRRTGRPTCTHET